jgi:hypothetical protein
LRSGRKEDGQIKLEKTVLSEQIKERLMDDILSGKYAPAIGWWKARFPPSSSQPVSG